AHVTADPQLELLRVRGLVTLLFLGLEPLTHVQMHHDRLTRSDVILLRLHPVVVSLRAGRECDPRERTRDASARTNSGENPGRAFHVSAGALAGCSPVSAEAGPALCPCSSRYFD